MDETLHLNPHQKLLLNFLGWCSDYNTGANGKSVNYHTHGFRKTFNHLDIQIVYPLGGLAYILFAIVADLLKSGIVFTDGSISDDILEGYSVKFVAQKDDGRDVLRMILADPQNQVERYKMYPKYRVQYDIKT